MKEINRLEREARGPAFAFDETIYGPVLLPGEPPEAWKKLKPRDFFQAFPEIAQLSESPTGDLLRWLHADAGRMHLAEERARAKELLCETMAKITTESGKAEIACSALKLRLKAASNFDERRQLGYESFREWLEDCADVVTFVDFRSGGRVRLLGPGETASPPAQIPPSVTRRHVEPPVPAAAERLPNGYIIVESASILHSLSDLLGRDPDSGCKPNWDIVMKFFRTRWPADVWKGLYFVYAPKERSEGLDGFFKYLSSNGFQPIHLYDRDGQAAGGVGPPLATMVQQQIDAMRDRDCHLVVISHAGSLATHIEPFLRAPGRRGKTAICGLLDLMESSLCALRSQGAEYFDLERDVRAFRESLPRFRPVPADQFDPTRYL
jgi:uncharacterized protein